MSTGMELGGVEAMDDHVGDVRGIVLAITAVLAAAATFLVTPGSGVGPAALAVLAWLAALSAASWAALVDDGSSIKRRIAAGLCTAALGAGFVASVASAWALAFPAVALAAALGRRRSLARVVSAGALLAAIAYILVGGLD